MSAISLQAPFDRKQARALRAGDSVLISGTVLAARDAAHKRLVECLEAGTSLPVDLEGQVIYYVGPSPARPGHALGAAGPTTSGRMDAYAPRLMAEGVAGMIGKGYRSQAVVEAMKTYGVPYLAPFAGGMELSQAGRAVVRLPLSWVKLRDRFLKTPNRRKQR